MTAGISQRLLMSHCNLFIFEVGNLRQSEQDVLQSLRENMVAGVIFLGQTHDYAFLKSLQTLLEFHIPVVYMNRVMKSNGFPVIYPDFFRASELAATHLVKSGKRRLALLHQLTDQELVERHRVRYAAPALAVCIPCDEAMCKD